MRNVLPKAGQCYVMGRSKGAILAECISLANLQALTHVLHQLLQILY